MKQDEQDPQRWADRANGPSIEDQVGADLRKIGEPVVPDDHALYRLEQRVVLPAGRRRRPLSRLAIAFGVVLVFAGGAVSAQLGGFPFQQPPTPTVDELSVPKGSTVRLRGKRQRRIALVGPAEVTVSKAAGETDSIAVHEGLMVINAGEQPVAVAVDGANGVNGVNVTVPAGSAGTVSASRTEQPEAIVIAGTMTVTSSQGTTILGQGQTWRPGATTTAPPERLDSAVRALNGEARVEPRAEVPPASVVPPSTATQAPTPTPIPTPPPAQTPAPSVKQGASGSSPRAPARATLAMGQPAATKAIEATPPAVASAPPAFPAPALPDPTLPDPTLPAPMLPAPMLPAPRALPLPQISPPVIASPPPPDGELALIATAVRKLRSDHDPKGALAVLDDHRTRFPSGALTREATLARVETLLALDRRAEALRVLDDAAIAELPRSRAVRTTRGELRAELGRCTDAMKDFELVLSSNQRDDYAERALYGRAVCLARAGETARARSDLIRYRDRYPQGRFAADVQRLLDGR